MGLMWVRSIGQELLWSYLWGSSCFTYDVFQINGAGAAVGLMWVRSMGQEQMWA